MKELSDRAKVIWLAILGILTLGALVVLIVAISLDWFHHPPGSCDASSISDPDSSDVAATVSDSAAGGESSASGDSNRTSGGAGGFSADFPQVDRIAEGSLSHLTGPRLQDPWYQSLPDHQQLPVMRLAVCIGINYEYPGNSSGSRLYGCGRDAALLCRLLQDQFGWVKDDIWLLTDTRDPEVMTKAGIAPSHVAPPIRVNILNALDQLTEACLSYEGPTEVFLTFAGHGTYQRDTSGDEYDGKDECWVPCDAFRAGVITDDEILAYLQRLPPRARWHCVFDCCHSGTLSDLEWCYFAPGFRLEYQAQRDPARKVQAEVRVWSGCADSGTSAETWNSEEKGVQGALTNAFVTQLGIRPRVTSVQMLDHLRDQLRYTQTPQLGCSRAIDPQDTVLPSYWLGA